ncbi:hypothetical protein B1R27_30825, partial [Streptomyces sp. GKU 895]
MTRRVLLAVALVLPLATTACSAIRTEKAAPATATPSASERPNALCHQTDMSGRQLIAAIEVDQALHGG